MAINEPDRKGECRAARNCLEDEAYRANKTASTAGSESSLVDPASVAKLLSKKDNAGKIKLKKSNPKPKAKDADSNGMLRINQIAINWFLMLRLSRIDSRRHRSQSLCRLTAHQ